MNEFEPLKHKLLPITAKINEDIWEKFPSSFWNKVKFSTEVKIKRAGVRHVLVIIIDEIFPQLVIDSFG